VYASPNASFVVEAPGYFIQGTTLNVFWSENACGFQRKIDFTRSALMLLDTDFKPDYDVRSVAVSVFEDPLQGTYLLCGACKNDVIYRL
jgi:hypothetical protein